jgi:hypothetical protein
MKALRIVSVTALCAAAALLVFEGVSWLAWQIFPFPFRSDQLAQTSVWFIHLGAEKGASMLICVVVAFVAAKAHWSSWKTGLLTGLLAALTFQVFAALLYVARFGFAYYARYHGFVRTMFETALFGGVFSFLAVWPQYRREVTNRSNQTLQPTAGRSDE